MSTVNLSLQLPIEVFWGEMSACEHFVQIYDDTATFMNTLEDFIGDGLQAGESAVIIATAAHLQMLEQRLISRGLDLETLCAQDRYIPLNAEKILAKFMINGFPDDKLFNRTVVDILARAQGNGTRKVRAFGEMVALLWEQGHQGATVQMEYLWQDLCRTYAFSLFCAYPRKGFTQNATQSIAEICAAHSKVIPTQEIPGN